MHGLPKPTQITQKAKTFGYGLPKPIPIRNEQYPNTKCALLNFLGEKCLPTI